LNKEDEMFDVKTKKENGIYYLYLTRNGYQWTAIPLKNINEIKEVILYLKDRVLKEKCNDNQAVLRKTYE